jgi:hypothetical protein
MCTLFEWHDGPAPSVPAAASTPAAATRSRRASFERSSTAGLRPARTSARPPLVSRGGRGARATTPSASPGMAADVVALSPVLP